MIVLDAPEVSGGIITSTNDLGVLGSTVLGTGENGPAPGYQYLNLPGDNNLRVLTVITRFPTQGLMLMDPNGSFSYVGNDDTFDVLVYLDGAPQGNDTHTLDVNFSSNQAPVADAGPDQSGIEGLDTVTLDGTGSSDPDLDSITYLWTQVGGPSVTLSDATVAQPSFIAPSDTEARVYGFSLVVNDGTENSSADFVNISVLADSVVVTPPTSDAGPDQSNLLAGATVTLDGRGSFHSPETGPLTYLWSQTSGTTVTLSDTTVAQPTFTAPSNVSPETLTFSLVVNDGTSSSVSDTVDIGVLAVANQAPIADAGPNQTGIVAGATVTLDGTGSSDPDLDSISYLWTQVAGTTVTLSSNTAAQPTFIAPTTVNDQTISFTLVVDDGLVSSSSDLVSIGVLGVSNVAPVADAGTDQVDIVHGTAVTLDGSSSSDADLQSLTYLWTQTAGTTVSLSDNTAVNPTFTSPSTPNDQTLTFRLVVNDSLENSAPDTVNIGVLRQPNLIPIADAGPTQSGILAGYPVVLDGSGSSDPEGSNITYSWTQILGTSVILNNPNTVNPNFTSPLIEQDELLTFQLIVNDGLSDSLPDTVTIGALSRMPILNANAGADQIVEAGSIVKLNAESSSAIDTTIASYQWQQIAGEAVEILNSTLSKAHFKAPDNITHDSVLIFRLTISDGVISQTDDTYITAKKQVKLFSDRIEQILSKARITLGDTKKQRFEDSDLLCLLDEGQKDFCRQTFILKDSADLPLVEGVSELQLPENCWMLTRATYKGDKFPLYTYADIDNFVSNSRRLREDISDLGDFSFGWENTTGSPEALIYDKNNMSVVRVYPIPDETINIVNYPFEDGDVLGVVDTIEDYSSTGPFGLTSELYDPTIDLDFSDGEFGVVSNISTTDGVISIRYIKIPEDIIKTNDSLEIPKMFDTALKYYVTGQAFLNDLDAGWQEKGLQQLRFYDREVEKAQESESKNFIRAAEFATNYRSAF